MFVAYKVFDWLLPKGDRRLPGLKFRRQRHNRSYCLNFYSFHLRTAIGLDAGVSRVPP